MFFWIFILFFMLEIAGFIIVGKLIGVLFTLLLIVLTTCLGIATLREEGLRSSYQHMQMMRGSRKIDPEKMPNALAIFAAFLLIIPGFITDILGLILLVPFVRKLIEAALMKRGVFISPQGFGPASNDARQPSGHIRDGDIIEGECEREDPK